ncbi:hypothetical protein RGQ29_005613 [Quercus rubra]|uniref:Uncharacterized protein n=1 Tax=Quercus rubra TaxID=3512 RepID=A0AAN7E4R1_QUERU|nr:hypothetical protein RGQ29_005613 [Quercus rubra]
MPLSLSLSLALKSCFSNLRFSNHSDHLLVSSRDKGGANSKPLISVVFEPFEEVKKELDLVPTVPQLFCSPEIFR